MRNLATVLYRAALSGEHAPLGFGLRIQLAGVEHVTRYTVQRFLDRFYCTCLGLRVRIR